MGIEYFYQFIDRAAMDPVLSLTWNQYQAKYGFKHDQWKHPGELIDWFVDEADLPDDPDSAEVKPYLNWTLRRTMRNSTPQYYFLIEVALMTSHVEGKCPHVWPDAWEAEGILIASSVNAFLRGEINEGALRTVFTVTATQDPGDWLRLTDRDQDLVLEACESWPPEKPIYPWQPPDCLRDDGYSVLGLADTKRFLGFLQRAWDEDWPAPRLKPWARKSLKLPSGSTPRFREFDLTRKLVKCVREATFEKPCLIRYFG